MQLEFLWWGWESANLDVGDDDDDDDDDDDYDDDDDDDDDEMVAETRVWKLVAEGMEVQCVTSAPRPRLCRSTQGWGREWRGGGRRWGRLFCFFL